MCCPVVQGYGLTETCAASFIAVPDVYDQAGTVGPPQPVLSFRLEAVPEMNYDPIGSPARGELCVKGPSVFTGYYKAEVCRYASYKIENFLFDDTVHRCKICIVPC